MTTRNNSFLLEPNHDLECYFLIHLPYGNQIELNLFQNFYTKSMNNGSIVERRRLNQDKHTSIIDDIDYEYVDLMLSQYVENVNFCLGIAISISDANDRKWSHCINSDSQAKKISFRSSGNSMLIHVARIYYSGAVGNSTNIDARESVIRDDINNRNMANSLYDTPSLYIEYTALPVFEIVSQCAFGWIAVNQFCISAIELTLTWKEAESHCQTLGGHLASIKSEREQKIIDTLLMNR